MKRVSPVACRPRVADYSFLWWAHGASSTCCPRRGNAPKTSDRQKVVCIQAGRYGLALDAEKVELLHFGPVAKPVPAAEAVAQGNEAVFALPKGILDLSVTTGGTTYTCVRGAVDQRDHFNFPIRLIESGRFVQRIDVLQLVFEDKAGRRLNAAGRLEMVAWPDRLRLLLEVTPEEPLTNAALAARFGNADRVAHGSESRDSWAAGQKWSVMAALAPGAGRVADAERPLGIEATTGGGRSKVKAIHDPTGGMYRVELPSQRWSSKSGTYDPEEHLDRLDRYRVKVSNPADRERVCRLRFVREPFHAGITGFTPMIRDAEGHPTGIPVQLSKNWHSREERRALYDGAWFHGSTMLHLPPRSETELELAIAYARWGGVPAASHAQLCLIGWGTNQRWDEAAIGSFGESICYEPDGCQRRCMIDDVRPLMVWQMNSKRRKWGWTNNVGGGDFLVYVDERGLYQYLTHAKADYRAHGPNLTDVVYAGTTVDGHIAVRVGVSTPRCDDINRAFHRLRYDVLKPTRFQRLAFYQLGADHYLWFQFLKMARGNASGLVEEWTPKLGGKRYHRTGIPCEGDAPWFSLHETVSKDTQGGAWANRGLIIRSWKARLGGKDVPTPFASVYGTAVGAKSASLELSPPPGVKELLPGDFVEAEVELVIMPMKADDYYGPNDGLRAALKAGGNTWKPIHREAAGNHLGLAAQKGIVRGRYPVVVQVDDGQRAELTVAGGVGYVPITFTGLADCRGYKLSRWADGKWVAVDQGVHGNDFWQTDHDPVTDTWRITYNVSLDTPGDERRSVRFAFGRKEP